MVEGMGLRETIRYVWSLARCSVICLLTDSLRSPETIVETATEGIETAHDAARARRQTIEAAVVVGAPDAMAGR
jgi:hypothetical protein